MIVNGVPMAPFDTVSIAHASISLPIIVGVHRKR